MNKIMLTRRRLLAATVALTLPKTAAAQPQPWQAQFIAGGFDGKAYVGGLHLQLEPQWKTYWRVPGSGGIPPTINLAGTNLRSFSVQLPLPQRFKGEEGETIGYKNAVVFSFIAEPIDSARPIIAKASAFIGVCDTICIPVPLEQDLLFEPLSASTPNDVLLKHWQAKVPRAAKQPLVTFAKLTEQTLVLGLAKKVDDIFVEGPGLLDFAAPVFDPNSATVRLRVMGLKSPSDLVGQTLKLTLASDGEGLEQTVTVV